MLKFTPIDLQRDRQSEMEILYEWQCILFAWELKVKKNESTYTQKEFDIFDMLAFKRM